MEEVSYSIFVWVGVIRIDPIAAAMDSVDLRMNGVNGSCRFDFFVKAVVIFDANLQIIFVLPIDPNMNGVSERIVL